MLLGRKSPKTHFRYMGFYGALGRSGLNTACIEYGFEMKFQHFIYQEKKVLKLGTLNCIK